MPSKNRRAGIIELQQNGNVMDAVGSFTCNYGRNKKEGLVGPTGVQGYKENPQIAYIEGEIRDAQSLDIDDILNFDEGTITLTYANGKSFMLEEAWYAADGDLDSDEGKIQVKFEGMSADEVPA